MLTPWHYLALAAPLVLLLIKRDDKVAMIVLTIAILFAAAQAITDTRIRAIRIGSPVPISSLPLANPLRRRFGILHGISSLLLLAEAGAAGIVVARR